MSTPEVFSDAEEKLQAIYEADEIVASTLIDLSAAEATVKTRRKAYERALDNQRFVIRQTKEKFLWDKRDEDPKEPEVSEVVQEVRTEALVTSFDVPTTGFSEADIKPYGVVLPEPPPGVADWTAISLRVAGISDRRSEILEAADIFNLGQLYERNSNGATILDIDRVTPKFGEAIAATVAKFFEKIAKKKPGKGYTITGEDYGDEPTSSEELRSQDESQDADD